VIRRDETNERKSTNFLFCDRTERAHSFCADKAHAIEKGSRSESSQAMRVTGYTGRQAGGLMEG